MKKSFSKMVSAVLCLFAVNVTAQNYGDWSALLSRDDNWFASNSQAVTVGNQIIQYQLADGGWRKDPAVTSGEWAKSTIDNDATISEIIFLARLYRARNTASYLTSLQRGIDLLLNGQYTNGGWPQIFSAGSSTYHAHITFNDGAMTQVMDLLFDVSRKSAPFTFIDNDRASRAKTAVERGIDCILRAQIVFTNGDTTAWCQQHDRNSLAPRSARAYEVPSVTASESIGIVNFLKKYNSSLGANPRRDIVLSINAAIRWLDKVKIEGIRMNDITTNGQADRVIVADPASTLWARFYELNTARPIFVGRDGIVRYNMADIEQERRAGYRWYGNWPRNLIRDGLLPVPGAGLTSIINNNAQPANCFLRISHTENGRMINVNYTIKDKSAVQLDLFDIKGNRVRTLSRKTKNAGTYTERFSTGGLAKGMYLVKLRAGSQTLQERVLIAK